MYKNLRWKVLTIVIVGEFNAGKSTFINALANNASRQLRDDKWYYAWALSRQVNTESS